MNITLDIVSDFVCPWCFIGHHQLKYAIARIRTQHEHANIMVSWLPYQLNPHTPPEGEPYRPFLEKKWGGKKLVDQQHRNITKAGAVLGIPFHFDFIQTRPNTLLAHRLICRAQSLGHQPKHIEQLAEGLFSAHFQRGENIADIETLAKIAQTCGDDKEAVITYLTSEEGLPQVMSLLSKVQKLGIDGVPCFIVQRQFAITGAQSSDSLAEQIMQNA